MTAELALTELKKMLATNPNVKDLIIDKGEQTYANTENVDQ